MILVSKVIWLIRYLGVIENYSLPKEGMLDQIKTCVSRFDLNGFLLEILRSSSLHGPHGSVNIVPLLPSILKNNCNYFLTVKRSISICACPQRIVRCVCVYEGPTMFANYTSVKSPHTVAKRPMTWAKWSRLSRWKKSGRPVVISITQSLFTKRMRCGSTQKFKAFAER